MSVCVPVLACLQPILFAGIGLLPFVLLSSSSPLTIYVVVLALSPMISLVICAPKGKWWLLIMTLNQAVVYALTVLAMHFTLPVTIFLLIITYPATHFYLYIFLSGLQQDVTPTVEDWGVFAWISAQWTRVLTTVLFGYARWFSDRCTDFLEYQERERRRRLPTYQPPSPDADSSYRK